MKDNDTIQMKPGEWDNTDTPRKGELYLDTDPAKFRGSEQETAPVTFAGYRQQPTLADLINDADLRLTRALNTKLIQEKNFGLVEHELLKEMLLQRQAHAQGITYDKMPLWKPGKKLFDLLDGAFQDIVGLPVPRDKAYIGKRGELGLQAALITETIQEHYHHDHCKGKGPVFSLPIQLAFLWAFTLRRLKNSYGNNSTHIDEDTLHQAAIVQAHESYHKVTAAPGERRVGEIRDNIIIAEGGARHFQTMVNKYLAKKTGDKRFLYSRRETILAELTPLYFKMCKEFGKTPVITRDTFIKEVERYFPEDERRKAHMRLLSDPLPNHYARGYTLFKMAEERHNPKDVHQAVMQGDASLLLG